MDPEEQRKILDDVGFQPAGAWALDNGRPAPELTAERSDAEALYAFVVGGVVVFLGRDREAFGGAIGGEGPLGLTRRYTTGNDRRIIEALMAGETIEIRAMKAEAPITYRGWRLNVAAGLRDALVRKLRPAWNQGGNAPTRTPF